MQSEAIPQARNKIQQELISWQQTQFVACPFLKPYISAVRIVTIECVDGLDSAQCVQAS